MSDLSEKFGTLEGLMADQNTAILASLSSISDVLGLLNTALDTLNNNGATNTRALLSAIGANSPCAPCPTPPLTVPPTDPTDRALGSDKCKRTQAFLHAMAEVFTVLDTMSAFSIPFSPSLISDAISQVITALENGDETPLPSYPEAVQIVGDGINYIAGNLLVGDTLSALFAGQVFDLQSAIYLAPNAASDQEAYNEIIDGSDIPSYAKPLMKDAAYNELWSYYFDPGTDPNLTGYSGTACGVSVCDTVASVAVTATDSFFPALTNRQMIELPNFFPGDDTFGGTVFSEDIVAEGALGGWTITLTVGTNARVVIDRIGTTQEFLTNGVPFTLPGPTSAIFVDDVTAGLTLSGAFTVEWCSPG